MRAADALTHSRAAVAGFAQSLMSRCANTINQDAILANSRRLVRWLSRARKARASDKRVTVVSLPQLAAA
jgi:hypothetical protein